MTDKIVRGNLLVFTSTPRDAAGNVTTPDSMSLYLEYVHANGVASVDPPLAMDPQTDQSWTAQFDTKVCKPGAFFASIRAVNPSGSDDMKLQIIANAANPDP
jgi:hypothetical protein